MSSLGTCLLVIAFIILLPIIIAAAGFQDHRYKQKLSKLVQVAACGTCGKSLGLEALRLADSEWSANSAPTLDLLASAQTPVCNPKELLGLTAMLCSIVTQ